MMFARLLNGNRMHFILLKILLAVLRGNQPMNDLDLPQIDESVLTVLRNLYFIGFIKEV